MRGRFIPYPLQLNIWRLPPDEIVACLEGLVQALASKGGNNALIPPPSNFREWIISTFGQGLADVFMLPYNRKVWGYPAEKLNYEWIGGRVATPDLSRAIRNLVYQQDEITWGPNSTFRYPRRGGVGAIWEAFGERIPRSKLMLQHRVTAVDWEKKQVLVRSVTNADTTEKWIPFDFLISTIPLDVLLRSLLPQPSDMIEESESAKNIQTIIESAGCFAHSSVHIVGVPLQGQPPSSLSSKCWIYFPEDDCIFFRVTVFSNYSDFNVPRAGEQWSLLCEVSDTSYRSMEGVDVVAKVIEGLRNTGMLPPETPMAGTPFYRRFEYGYPTPFIGRDAVLSDADRVLSKLGILSRGRFGGWKYEASNQDHSFMQGVEAVDRILLGKEERTYNGDINNMR